MNREYLLPVCDKHQIHLSFVRGFFKMPKHWRGPPLMVRCTKRNCVRPADHWLVIEMSEGVFGEGLSPLS